MLGCIETEASQSADEGSVEADILQVPANIQLNDIDHLIDVPRSDLIGDESRDFPLLILNECLQDLHHAGVDFGSQSRLVGELAAEVSKKTSEMEFQN